MKILSRLRLELSSHLSFYTFRHYKSRLFYTDARKYSRYLHRCQSMAPVNQELCPLIADAVQHFNTEGFAAFSTPENEVIAKSILRKIRLEEAAGLALWDDDYRYRQADPFSKFSEEFRGLFHGTLGPFLNGVLKTNYVIFYSLIYKSIRVTDLPEGSQLWHMDGGPGTCINVMFCLTETSPENGAMKCLPWADTLEICKKEKKIVREERIAAAVTGKSHLTHLEKRAITCEFFKEEIEAKYSNKVKQPTGGPGLVYAFRNNCIHAGGFPEPGQERIVAVMHIYPCMENNLDWCCEHGAAKRSPYPNNPEELERFPFNREMN